MKGLDPRAQLAWLVVGVLAALLGGDVGLIAAACLAGAGVLAGRAASVWLRLVRVVLPLALVVMVLDGLAGDWPTGARAALRLVVVASLGSVFATIADGEALVAGLRALRVPYAAVFVLVAGARFIPTATADLASVRDSARLRGLSVDGPPWRQLAGWRILLVPVLVGTVRRGLQLGEAMEARAFGAGTRRTVRHVLHWRWRDSIGLASAAAFAALVVVGQAVSSSPR